MHVRAGVQLFHLLQGRPLPGDTNEDDYDNVNNVNNVYNHDIADNVGNVDIFYNAINVTRKIPKSIQFRNRRGAFVVF